MSPHRLLIPSGDAFDFVPLDQIAYHTGLSSEQIAAYRLGRDEWPRFVKDGADADDQLDHLETPFPGYGEWLERWPTLVSPLELPSGEAPNGSSIGLELLASAGLCTDAQYASLAESISTMAAKEGVQLSRCNVIGHGDANPIARCSSRGLTDPGPHFDWARLYASLGI